ncbi:ABC-three component system protein [Vibrio owensii]|uniref:ABC-three component system protein n=1 Tax=Vibrio owensii TaxID=696485 RepID=UPI003AAC450D
MPIIQTHPHTAISTWSGFVYQGKLALMHCLKLINNDYEHSRNLRLQLESEDDFAIFDDVTCLSIHQVKAYKSDLFSSYEQGISNQKKQALSRGVKEAYFHVARPIRDIPTLFSKDYYPVAIYEYLVAEGQEKRLYLPLNDVDEFIEQQIKELVLTSPLPDWKKNFCNHIREALEALINSKVVSVHNQIHTSDINQRKIAAEEFIDFSEIYDVLEVDDYEALENEDYFLSRLQIEIGFHYYEFCEQQQNLTPENCNKLDRYVADIIGLDVEGMKTFLRATMPHRKGNFATLNDYKRETIDRDSMRQGLFSIFHQLIGAKVQGSGKPPFVWENEGIFYFPTGIHTAKEHEEVICYDILKRAYEEDVECLFERGKLITSAIDKQSISHVKFGFFDTNNSISSFMDVGLVSIKNVPESLKDEGID